MRSKLSPATSATVDAEVGRSPTVVEMGVEMELTYKPTYGGVSKSVLGEGIRKRVRERDLLSQNPSKEPVGDGSWRIIRFGSRVGDGASLDVEGFFVRFCRGRGA